jgi:hypothetical protein
MHTRAGRTCTTHTRFVCAQHGVHGDSCRRRRRRRRRRRQHRRRGAARSRQGSRKLGHPARGGGKCVWRRDCCCCCVRAKLDISNSYNLQPTMQKSGSDKSARNSNHATKVARPETARSAQPADVDAVY